MKLLLDQNLSRKLIGMLAAEFPNTEHVLHLGMEKKDDTDIWDFAASNGYSIISKDKDFYQRSVAIGHPPKVIHLHIGNCSVKETEDALQISAAVASQADHILTNDASGFTKSPISALSPKEFLFMLASGDPNGWKAPEMTGAGHTRPLHGFSQ